MEFLLDLLVDLLDVLLIGALVALLPVWIAMLWVFAQHLRHFARGRAIEARIHATPLPDDRDLPAVLVQIPVYNEAGLVARAMDAAARLDWPRDKLQIQVLDDSRDETTEIARERAAALSAEHGLAIDVLHREDRTGFKAGALKEGLARSASPFVLILDVDYVPDPDLIRRCIAPLLEPALVPARLGFVQARWGYLNLDESALTRFQALTMDAHFVVEQTGRCWSGLPMTFNGTCGIWRREAIEAAGGWEGDCLAEDLDLAVRAYIAGWRGWMLTDVEVKGELPPSLRSWQVQQARWTKGMAGVARKLIGPVWRASLPVSVKLMITLQFGLSAAVPLAAGIAVGIVLIVLVSGGLSTALAIALAANLALGYAGPIFATWRSQIVLGRFSFRRYAHTLFCTVTLFLGMAIINARGVLATFGGAKSVFERTPKSGN